MLSLSSCFLNEKIVFFIVLSPPALIAFRWCMCRIFYTVWLIVGRLRDQIGGTTVGTRQWSIALVYPRPLIKPHYDGHHGIDIYLQDNASPPVWWRIAWEPVMTKRPGSRNSVKIAMLKTTRSVRRSMLMNSIGMTFDF